MDLATFVRWLHVLGATVLLGTGGVSTFAKRTGDGRYG